MTTRTKWILLIIFIAYVVTTGTITINNVIKLVTINIQKKYNQSSFEIYVDKE